MNTFMMTVYPSLMMIVAIGIGVTAGKFMAFSKLPQYDHNWYAASNILLTMVALLFGHMAIKPEMSALPVTVATLLYVVVSAKSRRVTRERVGQS
tara:strand:+ start:174366 stop:174650 length:285 start_codon:yes stop_codon:yes gene_type:complete